MLAIERECLPLCRTRGADVSPHGIGNLVEKIPRGVNSIRRLYG
jgi:hypothetical protein